MFFTSKFESITPKAGQWFVEVNVVNNEERFGCLVEYFDNGEVAAEEDSVTSKPNADFYILQA